MDEFSYEAGRQLDGFSYDESSRQLKVVEPIGQRFNMLYDAVGLVHPTIDLVADQPTIVEKGRLQDRTTHNTKK